MRARRVAVAVLAGALGLTLAASALAQEAAPVEVTVRQATLDDDGATEVVVAVTGTAVQGELPADAFTVLEAGEPVTGVEVTPLADVADPEARTAIVVFDTSGSTAGEALESAKDAAQEFVSVVTANGVAVGLVTFSDTAQLVLPPTPQAAPAIEAIEGLEAGGETAFYDAVLVAARTLQNIAGQRSIVVFTDGADTVSQANEQAALNAADAVDATVASVALTTEDMDIAPLQRMAAATGGLFVEVTDVAQLETAFGQLARSITNQYVLTYTSVGAGGEFDLTVQVAVGDEIGTDSVSLLSPRPGGGDAGEPRVVELPDAGVLGTSTALYVSLAALGVAVLVILAILLVPTGDRRVARTLERGMRAYSRRGEPGKRAGREPATGSGAIGRRAVELVQAVPKPKGYDERLQLQLDRAAWPLRAGEFTTLRVLAVIVGVLIGWGLLGQWLLAAVFALVGWFLPRLLLGQRVSARQAKFLEQLPDTLQLLAGSLKAGYGILQGIDTIVKETAEPTASEFQRALTEARLGLPLEESLESMADRIGSDDFRWVTVAINIQRRVGGNLAELLDTVASTLREREMVRRQIGVLSAEGKLSAVILTALPVVLAIYMTIVNPDYIGTLFENTVGQIMIAGWIVLIGVGIFWMRRLIDIDV
jgi:tight adherence protein B